MFDGIQYRGFKQSLVEELAEYAGVPVWNGLTDVDHLIQILADFLTLQENFGRLLKGIRLVLRRRKEQHVQRPHDRMRQAGNALLGRFPRIPFP